MAPEDVEIVELERLVPVRVLVVEMNDLLEKEGEKALTPLFHKRHRAIDDIPENFILV